MRGELRDQGLPVGLRGRDGAAVMDGDIEALDGRLPPDRIAQIRERLANAEAMWAEDDDAQATGEPLLFQDLRAALAEVDTQRALADDARRAGYRILAAGREELLKLGADLAASGEKAIRSTVDGMMERLVKPLMAERDQALAEVQRLTVEVQTQRGKDYARVGELAAERAEVLRLCNEWSGWALDLEPMDTLIVAIRRVLGAEQ